MAEHMVRQALLILWVMVASLMTASIIHAAELPDRISIECSGYVHSDGDADQSQGDSDGLAPHHHGGCHAAASLIPARSSVPQIFAFVTGARGFGDETRLDRWSPGPDLRPPIA